MFLELLVFNKTQIPCDDVAMGQRILKFQLQGYILSFSDCPSSSSIDSTVCLELKTLFLIVAVNLYTNTVLKALPCQSFEWISATKFAELIQFWQDPECWRNRTFLRKINRGFIGERFHNSISHIFFPSFAFYFLVSYTKS